MGTQAGIWKPTGFPIEPETEFLLAASLAPRASGRLRNRKARSLFVAAEDVTLSGESMSSSEGDGVFVTWDGRIDNRDELVRALKLDDMDCAGSAPELVRSCYLRWGRGVFERLIGDWAIAIYDQSNGRLLLARDYMGIRPLYYRNQSDALMWSSELYSFTLLGDVSQEMDDDYLFGFLSGQLDETRTPYLGVSAVPPGHYVELAPGHTSVQRFWRPDLVDSLNYLKDDDYDDHFVELFQAAVQARLQPNRGAWAELSGGLDSSSVVCTAHRLKAAGVLSSLNLTTLSYVFSESASSNERDFQALVEAKCNFPHVHLDEDQFSWFFYDGCTVPIEHPRVCPGRAIAVENLMDESTTLLTGRGGDAIMWSMERPLLDLADFFSQGRYRKLLRRAAEYRRTLSLSVITLMKEVGGPGKDEWPWRRGVETSASCLNWSHAASSSVLSSARRDAEQTKRLTVLPSRRVAEKVVLDCIRLYSVNYFRSCSRVQPEYPYLDRRLVEFMLSVPFEQKVRPGRSRVLHRRALTSVLPVEIAERRSKAGADEPICRALRREWPRVRELLYSSVPLVVERGLVNWERCRGAVENARHGVVLDPTEIVRVLGLEAWMRQVKSLKSKPHTSGLLGKGGGKSHEI